MAPQTLSEADAATYIGGSRAWLRVMRKQGRGPAYLRINRMIRYRIADLDAFLSKHRVEPRALASA